jgi:hypothetical protein
MEMGTTGLGIRRMSLSHFCRCINVFAYAESNPKIRRKNMRNITILVATLMTILGVTASALA